MILADSNVLLDVIGEDPDWADWSQAMLDEWSRRGPVLINPVIYAELSPSFASMESLDRAIEDTDLDYREIPKPAL